MQEVEEKMRKKREYDRLKKQDQRLRGGAEMRMKERDRIRKRELRKKGRQERGQPEMKPKKNWKPLYSKEGDVLKCLGCLTEYTGIWQVHRPLASSSCGAEVQEQTPETMVRDAP